MNTELLSIFIDVMRRGSFAAVARDRGVNPGTISRAIVALEEHLQLRLFQRTTRKLDPTDAGRLYFERVEPIMEELRLAELSAADASKNPSGTLRITCPVSFAELNITPLLPKFAASYPELRFELLLTDSQLDLITEHIDIAIRIGALADSSLVAHRLATMETRVCATPEYLNRCGKPEEPEDLVNHSCLMLYLTGFNPDSWKFTDAAGNKTEVRLTPKLRTSNAMALKQCTLAHMGITLQATWMVGKELKNGSLVDLFPGYQVTAALGGTAAAWALTASRQYMPQKNRLFIDFLKQEFRHGAPWTVDGLAF